MKPTLASYIDFLTPFISPDLISEPYLNRIRTIAERLPVLSLGSFECWLAENEPRVDFNVCINPRVNEHTSLRDWRQEEVYFENDAYREMQEQLRSFCNIWSQKNFFLKPFLGELWQVYDITDLTQSLSPIPWFYISFLKNILCNDQTIKAEIISKTLLLLNNELPSDLMNKFYHALKKIPSSIRVGTIGINKRSENPSLRLYLEIITFEELIQFLREQHWLGNIDELRQKMAPWIEERYFFGLALDFDGEFQPKIGIECHFHSDKLSEDLSEFTQSLYEHGLCSTSKRKAILDWNNIFEVKTPPYFWSWPDRILEVPESIPQKVKIKKMISYIKIIFEPNKPLIAKVYPLFLRPVLRTH